MLQITDSKRWMAETGERCFGGSCGTFLFFSFIFLFSTQFPLPVFWPGDSPAFGAPLSRSSWMFFVLECRYSKGLPRISSVLADTWPDSYYVAARFGEIQLLRIHSADLVTASVLLLCVERWQNDYLQQNSAETVLARSGGTLMWIQREKRYQVIG